ncbi:MAG: cache domain-containing protein [Pseudomonadota bacterium]
MKKLFFQMVAGFVSMLVLNAAMAAERGTPEQAVALVKSAITYMKANGKEKALAEFNNPNGKFKDRDLYIFVVDFNGMALAQGANPKIAGKNVIELRDGDGKYFVKSYIHLAREKGQGWTDFRWVNPVSSALEQKSVYVEKYEDMVVGSGVYKSAN